MIKTDITAIGESGSKVFRYFAAPRKKTILRCLLSDE